MKVFITPVFDSTKPIQKSFNQLPKSHIPNVHFTSRNIVDPWTFYAVIHGLILTPRDMGEESYGFKSEKEAKEAQDRCAARVAAISSGVGVWCVFKYSETNSANKLDKVFRKPEGISEYILSKRGWGGEATIQFSMSNSIYDTIFYSMSYTNDHSFKFVTYSD